MMQPFATLIFEGTLVTPHLERVVSALERHGCRPKHTGEERWRAHCPGPAHARKDVRPSLGVMGLPDKVLLHCFVCRRSGTAEILRTLGLRMADLFAESAVPTRTGTTKRECVATYQYDDIDGELLGEKIRYTSKRFGWQSPDPDNPRQVIPRKATGITLYRLPHLIDARVVVVVEGEKAVDRLVAEGFVATCPSAGAATWTEAYTDALWRAGAWVAIVIPDNDRIGREHADRVVRLCHEYQPLSFLHRSPMATAPWASWTCAEATDPEVQPLRAAVLTLSNIPHHGDVYDWFELGHTADELQELILSVKDPTMIKHEQHERKKRLARDRQRRCRERKRHAADANLGVTLEMS